MIDRYQFQERVCICIESGLTQPKAEETAARQFFKSCNLPTAEDLQRADRLGWSKLKVFRTMNQSGFEGWRV